jgi:hypothetical protein
MDKDCKEDFKQYLIIAPVRFEGELDRFVCINSCERALLNWIKRANQKNGLVFDDSEEIKEFNEEVCGFARDLYQKKYKKEKAK